MTRKRDADKYAARLEVRRAELMEYQGLTEVDRSTVELDQTTVGRLSRMHAIQEQATAIATGRQREQELARIEAALQRIADGEYGYCLACGEPIDARRLDLDPSLPSCIDCARQARR
ncbi:MAG: TraR/DksA C4-type zinc finger protein [Hyphomicrobiaceae bacterium]|nr:TraR/DksA C4-type zinc finger protein [Hyphomicrobiaceae bacterium]